MTICDSADDESRPVTRRTRAVSVPSAYEYIDVLFAMLEVAPDPLRFAVEALTHERDFWIAEWGRLGDAITPRADARISRRIVRCERALDVLAQSPPQDSAGAA